MRLQRELMIIEPIGVAFTVEVLEASDALILLHMQVRHDRLTGNRHRRATFWWGTPWRCRNGSTMNVSIGNQ